jgi:Arc/MetJ family transcription regulator
MRTTLALDDDLVREAQCLTGMTEKAALVREALRALIERESARRLALLGGTQPELDQSWTRCPAAERRLSDHRRHVGLGRSRSHGGSRPGDAASGAAGAGPSLGSRGARARPAR